MKNQSEQRDTATERLFLKVLGLLLLIISPFSNAAIVDDWGTVTTSVGGETTFSFAQYDITRNFTDQYAFSLEGSGDATYNVSFVFDPCKNGCGNPNISYGIYDAHGGLIAATNGAVVLSAGNYFFQVKGNGMGSGNSVDYYGSITFSVAASSIVSPAPEPSTLVLMLFGLMALAIPYGLHKKPVFPASA